MVYVTWLRWWPCPYMLKKLSKIFFSGTERLMNLKLGRQHRELEYYKSGIKINKNISTPHPGQVWQPGPDILQTLAFGNNLGFSDSFWRVTSANKLLLEAFWGLIKEIPFRKLWKNVYSIQFTNVNEVLTDSYNTWNVQVIQVCDFTNRRRFPVFWHILSIWVIRIRSY